MGYKRRHLKGSMLMISATAIGLIFKDKMKEIIKRFLSLFQLIPLGIFMFYARSYGFNDHAWSVAFQVGAVSACIMSMLLLFAKIELSRFLLGVNLFLVGGGIAFFFKVSWLLNIYDSLQASALFVSLLIVGIVTTLCTNKGFIDVAHHDQTKVRLYSFYMMLGVVAAVIISYLFRQNLFIAGNAPFIALQVLSGKLTEHMKRS